MKINVSKLHTQVLAFIFTAHKVWARLYFYTCLSVILLMGEGVW